MDRSEMGAFLKACRGRIEPRSMGFAAGKRRRVSGLRREEVGELASISTDWYTRLEQGRDVRVSPEVLERLIRALALTASEAEYLTSLSGVTPGPSSAPAGDDQNGLDSELHQRMLTALNPHPAYYVVGPWDVVAWNRAAECILPELFAPEVRRNAMRMIFANSSFRKRLEDWERHARDAMAVFRRDYGRAPYDERFHRLAAELTIASPEFAQWWPQQEVDTRRPTEKRLLDSELGELNFLIQYYHSGDQPDCVLTVFTADSMTQQTIAQALPEPEGAEE